MKSYIFLAIIFNVNNASGLTGLPGLNTQSLMPSGSLPGLSGLTGLPGASSHIVVVDPKANGLLGNPNTRQIGTTSSMGNVGLSLGSNSIAGLSHLSSTLANSALERIGLGSSGRLISPSSLPGLQGAHGLGTATSLGGLGGLGSVTGLGGLTGIGGIQGLSALNGLGSLNGVGGLQGLQGLQGTSNLALPISVLPPASLNTKIARSSSRSSNTFSPSNSAPSNLPVSSSEGNIWNSGQPSIPGLPAAAMVNQNMGSFLPNAPSSSSGSTVSFNQPLAASAFGGQNGVLGNPSPGNLGVGMVPSNSFTGVSPADGQNGLMNFASSSAKNALSALTRASSGSTTVVSKPSSSSKTEFSVYLFTLTLLSVIYIL